MVDDLSLMGLSGFSLWAPAGAQAAGAAYWHAFLTQRSQRHLGRPRIVTNHGAPSAPNPHQWPSTRHQAVPTTSQITISTTLITKPVFHHSPSVA